MTTLDLGELASDQKINGIFRVFGFSIPLGRDGRRMWPKKFKQEMAKQMKSGKLSVKDIQRTCEVSEQTAYRWRKEYGANIEGGKKRKKSKFAEVVIEELPSATLKTDAPLQIDWRGVQLSIDAAYPVERLAQLIRHLGSAR